MAGSAAPAGAAREQALQQAEDEQQHADGDARPPRTERAVEGDERLDDSEHQHAEERAGHVAHAAREQRAAYDDGGDGIQLHAHGMQAVAREHVEGEHHAGQGRTEARQGVDAHQRGAHRQAHQQGRVLAAAHGIDRAAERRAVRDEDAGQHHGDGDQRTQRDGGGFGQLQAPLRELRIAFVRDADRVDADEVAQAPRQEHAGERDDEGLQPEALDQEAHERAEARAHQQHHGHGRRRAPAVALHQRGEHHGGERHHGAHGQVDAAREDDEGHAHRDDDEEGVVDQQVEEHLGREKARVAHRAQRGHGHEERDGGGQRQVPGVQAGAARAGGRGRGRGHDGAHGRALPVAGRRASRPTWARNSGDCSSMTTNTTTAFTTRFTSGGTPSE